ncbi:MAG: NAD(P)/FAD-dependent oxidoreductase [Bacteroidota bacterium]
MTFTPNYFHKFETELIHNPIKVAVIGGGAAGFFAAISCKQHHSNAEVFIYEKTAKLLAKVKISGGGRCNVTHNCPPISKLVKHYPRGERFLKKAFSHFAVLDTIRWFESRGVRLKTESDNRIFPVSDDSQTIIDCLITEVQKLGITVFTRSGVRSISIKGTTFELEMEGQSVTAYDKVIVCSGGSPKIGGFDWLKRLGHNIQPPVPSLFTFNMPNEPIRKLMGLSVENVRVRIQGSKLQYTGPLLITHWGMSGPAVLKLSAWGARYLNGLNYQFGVQVNWTQGFKEQEVRLTIEDHIAVNRKSKVLNRRVFGLPARLWEFLLNKIEIRNDITWGEIRNKSLNRLVNVLTNDIYTVKGKTTFKEEFVTCGGVDLSEVNSRNMESKIVPGLYFAGEVLDIDGITGGFNFQAAWTTGLISGLMTEHD